MRTSPHDADEARRTTGRAALRLTLVYLVVAALWIELSDRALAGLGLPLDAERAIASVKGLTYVLVTSIGLFLLSRRQLLRIYSFESRHRHLFENATEGLTMCRVARGHDGRVTDVVIEDTNDAQATRLGVERPALVGRSLSTEDDPRLVAYLNVVRTVADGAGIARQELRLEQPAVDEMLSVFSVGPELWVLACMDLTEIRRAQRVLRHREEWIRDAYVDVLDAVTGGKLVLLTEEEMRGVFGARVAGPTRIGSTTAVSDARRDISRAVANVHPELARSMRLLNPVGEALNNALKHAGSGEYGVFATPTSVQVCVTDDGPGIDFRTLPKAALVAGFSTAATLGMGFTIMLQLSDRLLISTRPGRTIVLLEVSPSREDRDRATAVRSATGDAQDAAGRDVEDVDVARPVLSEARDR